MQETWDMDWIQSLGQEGPLEEEMATHSSILAWRIPWTEEPDGPQSIGSQRVRRKWAIKYFHFVTAIHNIYDPSFLEILLRKKQGQKCNMPSSVLRMEIIFILYTLPEINRVYQAIWEKYSQNCPLFNSKLQLQN